MKRLVLLAAAVAAIASCAKVETFNTAQPEEIGFKSVATKVAETLAGNETMGVYAQTNTGSTWFTNTSFSDKNQDQNWVANPSKYWPNSGSLDFTVYSPYDGNATISDGQIIADVDKATDFLYGAEHYTGKKSGPVVVVLKHAKSKVTFKVQANKDNIYNITELSFSPNVSGQCTVTYPESVQWGGSLTTEKIDLGTKAVTTTATQIGLTQMVLPGDSPDVTIKYTMNGVAAPDATVTLNATWAEGKHYTYTLKFTADEITFDPSVTDWSTELNKDVEVTI